jgi:hypothetical protein
MLGIIAANRDASASGINQPKEKYLFGDKYLFSILPNQ